MKLASRCTLSILAVLSTLETTLAQDNSGLKPVIYKGCFTSSDGFEDRGSYTYQSPGYCQEQCVGLGKPVMALTGGSNCWCGDLLPITSSKTTDTQCGTSCQGYPDDKCGGDKTWSVSLTGLSNNVGNVQDSTSDSESKPKPNPPPKAAASTPTSSSTSTLPSPAAKGQPSSPAVAAVAVVQPDSAKNRPPSTITQASTVVVTAPGQAKATSAAVTTQKPSKGPNTAGIAAGVVVGVVVICAIAGGLFFFLRNRKRRAVEEEEHRSANANPFETEVKPPPSSGSMADSRLEPSVMMQRRQSDGSIADNQDYSRRILKVRFKPTPCSSGSV
ncbi:MAG: hypothetical protein Q9219_001506 [cf. Caloplaca sp. 3 TL-2023]